MRDVSKFLENGKENLNELLSPFLLNLSTITLVIYTAEKKEHIIPIINVIANPLTGPWPKLYKIKPTNLNLNKYKSIDETKQDLDSIKLGVKLLAIANVISKEDSKIEYYFQVINFIDKSCLNSLNLLSC